MRNKPNTKFIIMDEFQVNSDLACDVIEALQLVLTYPLGDNQRYLDMRLRYYSEAVFKENSSFHGDRSRHSIDKVLRSLSTYLRNPSGDNYLWLNSTLADYRYSQMAHKQEVTTNE